MAQFDPFSDIQELLLRTAYGSNTIGMPRLGNASNCININKNLLQDFRNENFTPKKTLIVASGIQDHKEFVDLCKEFKYDDHEYFSGAQDNFVRQKAQYLGGEYRAWAESPSTQITLAFESCPWSSDDVHTYYVMN